MSKILVLTQATNIQVNDEFWNKVNQLVGSYYKEVNNVIIPDKPYAPEMETAWIYEILNEAFHELEGGEMIFLDGRMNGNIIYNLAVGMFVALNPRYGSITVIGDNDTNSLLQVTTHELEEVQTVRITEETKPEGDESEVAYVNLANSLEYLRSHVAKNMVIDNSYPADDTIQRIMGINYYRMTKVTYSPEVSNSFIDFIVNS